MIDTKVQSTDRGERHSLGSQIDLDLNPGYHYRTARKSFILLRLSFLTWDVEIARHAVLCLTQTGTKVVTSNFCLALGCERGRVGERSLEWGKTIVRALVPTRASRW